MMEADEGWNPPPPVGWRAVPTGKAQSRAATSEWAWLSSTAVAQEKQLNRLPAVTMQAL